MDGLGTMIPTTNKKGFDLGIRPPNWDRWFKSYKGNLPIYDFGSGWGTNSLEAAKRGAKVVAVDMARDHLAKIREKAEEAGISESMLQTIFGELPDVDLRQECAAGILCSEVFHFLSPEKVEKTIANFFRWACPGATVVINVLSIYTRGNCASGDVECYLKAFEEEGFDTYPAWRPDYKSAYKAMLDTVPKDMQEILSDVFPSALHFFHPQQLKVVFEKAGFHVLEIQLVSGSQVGMPQWQLTPPDSPYYGKEQILLVAMKPPSIL